MICPLFNGECWVAKCMFYQRGCMIVTALSAICNGQYPFTITDIKTEVIGKELKKRGRPRKNEVQA